MAKIRAEIRLTGKSAPSVHHANGRTIKRGEVVVLTDAKEISYYQKQYGFSVSIQEGRLASVASKPKKMLVPEPEPEDEDPEESEEDSEEEDSDDEDSEDDGGYLKRDLQKLTLTELKDLIKDDDDIPLTIKDVPRKSKKNDVIELIMDAQEE